MARFDVYRNPAGEGLLLDVQADLLDGLNTRVVVPLFHPDRAPTPADRLNPVLAVEGENLIMMTQFLAAIPVSVIGDPLANLAGHHIAVTNALDMLFQGF